MKNRESYLNRQLIKGVVANSMLIDFMDDFKGTDRYKGKLKELGKQFFNILSRQLKKEGEAVCSSDDGSFGKIIEAQEESAKYLGQLTLDATIGAAVLLKTIAEYEKSNTKYKIIIEEK